MSQINLDKSFHLPYHTIMDEDSKTWTLEDKAFLENIAGIPSLPDIFRLVIKGLSKEDGEYFLNDYRDLVLRNKAMNLEYYIQKLMALPVTENKT